MPTLYEAPTKNAFQTTLAGTIGAGDTTITLASVTGLQYPGVIVIDRQNGAQQDTPTKREYISYTGISGNDLTGCSRGSGGSTAQGHTSGALIEATVSVEYWQGLVDLYRVAHQDDGNLNLDAAIRSLSISGVSGASMLTGDLILVPGANVSIVAISGASGLTNLKIEASLDPSTSQLSDGWINIADNTTMAFNLINTTNKLKFLTGALGGNRTFALSNVTTGKTFLVRTVQDSTGTRNPTWFTAASENVSITSANPGVVTTTFDMKTTTPVKFTTTGTLPSNIVAGTKYYWIRVSSTTGRLATSKANALAGTAIDTSGGSPSGTHTMNVQVVWANNQEPNLASQSAHAWDDFIFVVHALAQITGVIVAQDM